MSSRDERGQWNHYAIEVRLLDTGELWFAYDGDFDAVQYYSELIFGLWRYRESPEYSVTIKPIPGRWNGKHEQIGNLKFLEAN